MPEKKMPRARIRMAMAMLGSIVAVWVEGRWVLTEGREMYGKIGGDF